MSDVDVDPIRVLHVDDDPEIVDLATTFLEREDDRLTIEPAGSAEDALDRLAADDIHCLISDYQLPDMDCRAFVDAVNESNPGLPFVLFTGRDRTQIDDDLFADGVTAYLQKGSGVDQYGELAEAILTAVADTDVRSDGGHVPANGDIGDDELGDIEGLGADPEAVLTGALDSIRDGFFLLDTDGELVHWNRFILDRTGYDDAEMAAMEPVDLFVEGDRDRVAEAIERTRRDGAAAVEATVVTADGEEVPVEFRGSQLTDADGNPAGVAGIARDVSDRVAYERELKRQNERLEELIGAVSHDLRNPLNVITGRLQLARETGDEQHFDALERASHRVETLVEDLVELARQGNTVGNREPVELAPFATEIWDQLETGEATISVDTDRTVTADRSRLRQVFENLFRNSIEHVGPAVAVTVGDFPDGFYVEDDGPGIPPADRDRLWEYGESTTDDGTGLGLAIVRRIAQAHGWRAEMRDGDDGGVRIEFHDVDGSGPPGR